MKKEITDVSSVAAAYLKELNGEGMVGHKVVHGGDRCHCEPAYIEDTRAFLKRMQEERAKRDESESDIPKWASRYETTDVPMWFVLKAGHKYFYALKEHDIKWTYDINLAHIEHAFTVEGLICLLHSYDVETTKFPAPEKKNTF